MMKGIIAIILCFIVSVTLKAETYVVSVGIANYASPNLKNLSKTENDAKGMAEFFKKGTKHVITITGKYATKAQILKSIRSQFSRAGSKDRIIFYFSGHGYPGGFCPQDMMKLNEGLSYKEIVEIMNQSKASEKFIFADACHSGKIRKDNGTISADSDNILFFLASRGNEGSLESRYQSNGFFTKYLLRGLGGGADSNRDRKITASELFNYVSTNVKSQTEDRQHPVMWGKFSDDTVIVEYK